jgi:hypothetical protein
MRLNKLQRGVKGFYKVKEGHLYDLDKIEGVE